MARRRAASHENLLYGDGDNSDSNRREVHEERREVIREEHRGRNHGNDRNYRDVNEDKARMLGYHAKVRTEPNVK